MRVAEAVGRYLARLGVDHVFGVVGSGNFHVTNALVDAGARFVAARHEGGAATMADAYGRVTGRAAALSVHQGCGLTNALTGITEAAKSRTPLLVLAAEATEPRSNFFVDQPALARAVGAVSERVASPRTALADAARAYQLAVGQRRTVLLNLPLSVQAAELPADAVPADAEPAGPAGEPDGAGASVDAVARLADLLAGARRPVFIAGRGARLSRAREPLRRLAELTGALLATSAVAKGLFAGDPWSLGVSGGFASPLAAELIADADVIVGWGCGLNMWTMRHGKLVGPHARVAQVDVDADALGAHRPVDLGVRGDVRLTARAVADELSARAAGSASAAGGPADGGYRTAGLRERIATGASLRDVPYQDEGDGSRIDPRTLSIRLDDLLPAQRVLAVDSGNFMGYPSAYLSVPDDDGFCFTQAYQSIGLGLATAIGAALAAPARLPVAACGDGGFLMGVADLETVVRLGLPMLIVVYNDAAYGAEVHHFGPDGHPLSTVTFPDTDIAAIGRGFGCDAVTVRAAEDLEAVRQWLAGPRPRPLVVDAKVTAARGAWWLEEAFRGH
ncbi:thiamine pyrophosphate-binding protein [Rugosimonospora acidiphila]|uniref:Thiamine pyrophosphate-binding protein n=1 Tax=Rugosimonospora acidiphila TaxID=556531 RepID=A0ABP9SPZ8_9ACTN